MDEAGKVNEMACDTTYTLYIRNSPMNEAGIE